MRRAGTTLVELMVILALLAVVGGSIAAAFAAARRTKRGTMEIRAARAELRDGGAILSWELRGVAVIDTLRLAADTAVEFFAPIVTAVTCANSAGRRLNLTGVPPRRARPAAITVDTGDLAWIWRRDTLVGSGSWIRSRVAAYAEAPVECDPDLAAPGVQGRVLTLVDDPGDVQAGAPVQIVRRGRYSIYRAADGSWYLGYRRCDAVGPPRCQTVQPVAGPYRAKSATSTGLEFRYHDSAGMEVYGGAAAVRAWSLRIAMRSDTAKWERRAGRRAALDDSTVFDISFRNAF